MPANTFYVTTPIYYVNSAPHIGNAYTTIVADVIARYKRAMGYEVMFLTGTDEHGQKVQTAAIQQGMHPREYVDKMAHIWKDLWSRLDISNDDFIRTTQPRHEKGVLMLLQRIKANGDVYEGEYEGWYCKHEENFLTDLQVKDGKCPDCGRPVERFRERSFFFALSRYQKQLLEHYDRHPDFVRPDFRMNEAKSFIERGLKDLCISRYKLEWGIRIPGAGDYTLYVWIDALINYLTGVGFGGDEEMFKRFWPCDLHIIGKDILKFHCVYWPAMLMSAGLELPKTVYNHGWLRVAGEKMSKSIGNVVDPFYLAETYGSDAVRYFLMRDVQLGLDGNFSEDNVMTRYNSDLANDLGNLIHRSLSMCLKYFDGRIPSPDGSADQALRQKSEQVFKAYERYMDGLDFRAGLEEVWALISTANIYIDRNKPWELHRDGRTDQLGGILFNVLECGRIILHMLSPFVPSAASRMLVQMGTSAESQGSLPHQVKWGGLLAGTRIGDVAPPFRKIELPGPGVERGAGPGQGPIKEGSAMGKQTITIDEFAKTELVVGQITGAEPVSGSKNLLKLTVNIGHELRTAVAGMRKFYTPEEMVGKKVAFVANLAPVKIFGVQSQGMVLAADGEVVSLVIIDKDVPVGTQIR